MRHKGKDVDFRAAKLGSVDFKYTRLYQAQRLIDARLHEAKISWWSAWLSH